MFLNPDHIPESMKRPISDWLKEYANIIDSYDIGAKTRANRSVLIRWISENLGDYKLGLIKPYEISGKLKELTKISPQKSRRALIEIKNMFNEAIIYDWTDRNPAACLKSPKVKIQRERLSLDDWRSLYEYADKNSVSWVPILLLLAVVTGQRRSDILKMKYSDIQDDNLLVTQQKTGIKLAIPLSIRCNELGLSLGEIVEMTKKYYAPSEFFVHKHNGTAISTATASSAFETLVNAVIPDKNTCLHECRSLAERLYRLQGLDTRLLLGHIHQSMTDMYNNGRDLNKTNYTIIPIE